MGSPGGKEGPRGRGPKGGPLGLSRVSAGCSTARKKVAAPPAGNTSPRQLRGSPSALSSRAWAWRSLSSAFSSPRCPRPPPHFLVAPVAIPMSDVLEKRPCRDNFGAARERLCWDGNAETPGGPPAKDREHVAFSPIVKTSRLGWQSL